ncbi:uncharacterized protein DS421_11g333490 [Arachis hypogaea]|nr:uncharacterized protein DS421_11g333490 [Arachis hypogaea]
MVAGVVAGEDHRSCCLPLPRGSASCRSPLPPELPRTIAVAATGIVNRRRRRCFRYSHSRRRSQLRRRAELPEDSFVDPPELLAAAGAVAEPVQSHSCLIVLIRGWELRSWLPLVRVEAERTL